MRVSVYDDASFEALTIATLPSWAPSVLVEGMEIRIFLSHRGPMIYRNANARTVTGHEKAVFLRFETVHRRGRRHWNMIADEQSAELIRQAFFARQSPDQMQARRDDFNAGIAAALAAYAR